MALIDRARRLKARGWAEAVGHGNLAVEILAGLLALVGTSTISRADVQFCNRSSMETDVALGYYDLKAGWTAEGWWNVPIGACKTLWSGTQPGNARGVYSVYFYALNKNGSSWGDPDSLPPTMSPASVSG